MRGRSDELSPSLAVIDIDGVIADVRHRLHHISGRRRDWDAFFAGAPQDGVHVEGLSAVEAAVAERLAIVYVTGRPERCREDTRAWLAHHGFPQAPLHMRPSHDRRPARLYKVDVLRRLSADDDIAYMLDDDADVVEAVRAAGFRARHAGWMNDPEASLHRAQEDDGRS